MSSQSSSSDQPQMPVSDSSRPAAQFPLKWHKWMIYFVLWAHAVLSAINAAAYCLYISVTGMALLFAAVYFALAASAVYVRFQLAKLRRGAPKKLLIYLLCSLACSVAEAAIAGTLADSAGSIGIVGVQILWNWRYYTSRDELFVN